MSDVKPLDLANIIRLAILHGRGYACTPETRHVVQRLNDEDQAALMSFDPEGIPCFDRVTEALAVSRAAAR